MKQMTFFVRKLVLIVSFIDDAFGLLFTSWQQAVFDDLHERCKPITLLTLAAIRFARSRKST